MRAPIRHLALAVVLVGGAFACNEFSTKPVVPVSIEFRPPPSPSVVKGDTMRDSTGAAAPLKAIVFNSKGDTIANAPVRYLAFDTLGIIRVDSVSGIVVGNDTTGQALVLASAGSLQSVPDTIVVVDTPTTMIPTASLNDTIIYTFKPGISDTLQPLTVRILHLNGTDTVPVPRYVVRYQVLYPQGFTNTDSTKVQIVSPGRVASLVDTTDATGSTNRSFRISPITAPDTDSLVVQATAIGPHGGSLSGSPIQFIVHFIIQ